MWIRVLSLGLAGFHGTDNQDQQCPSEGRTLPGYSPYPVPFHLHPLPYTNRPRSFKPISTHPAVPIHVLSLCDTNASSSRVISHGQKITVHTCTCIRTRDTSFLHPSKSKVLNPVGWSWPHPSNPTEEEPHPGEDFGIRIYQAPGKLTGSGDAFDVREI